MRALPAAAVAALLLTAGCNSGDDPSIEVPSTTTTAATPSTGGGAESDDTTTSTGAAARAASPEQAAKGLFDAWKDRDRGRAGRFGSDRAVAALFDSGGSAGDMEYQGCEPQGAQFSCAWRYEGGGLIMTVQDAPEGGFVVELARFVAD